ncbi:hypothetical protein CRUP_021243, partial [Coryphaenoides rupestris]
MEGPVAIARHTLELLEELVERGQVVEGCYRGTVTLPLQNEYRQTQTQNHSEEIFQSRQAHKQQQQRPGAAQTEARGAHSAEPAKANTASEAKSAPCTRKKTNQRDTCPTRCAKHKAWLGPLANAHAGKHGRSANTTTTTTTDVPGHLFVGKQMRRFASHTEAGPAGDLAPRTGREVTGGGEDGRSLASSPVTQARTLRSHKAQNVPAFLNASKPPCQVAPQTQTPRVDTGPGEHRAEGLNGACVAPSTSTPTGPTRILRSHTPTRLNGSVALPNSMAVLGSGRKKASTVTSFLPNSHRRRAEEKGRNTAFRTKARHGVASRPLRRLGMAALLIRGGGDAELVGKQRYDRLCSNAASSSSSSSFTPRRRRSLRERKMREVKGEEKQRKREKGGRDKNEGEGMEGRRKREPVRVLRPRQLSLQVAMVTGLSNQHTSYVLQAPSITSKSTSNSRRSG